MYSLPKPGFDLETMRSVALAYRRERQAGQLDGPAREAAEAAFRVMCPDIADFSTRMELGPEGFAKIMEAV